MCKRGGCTLHPSFFKGQREMTDRIFKTIESIVEGFNKILVFIASLMMAGLMVIVCIDLTLRYFFNSPLLWGTEVTEILLLS